jgi:hypothetical protein
MTKRKPLSAKEFVYSELRTALVALRGIHNRARRKEMFGRQSTGRCLPPASPIQNCAFTVNAPAGHKEEGALSLEFGFVVEEGADHHEEAVLIAMDHESRDNYLVSASNADNRAIRLGTHATACGQLWRGGTGPLHSMRSGRPEINDQRAKNQRRPGWHG